MIFYFIPQHRYVIIDLKVVKYTPEFAGKLNFYVTAADELLRGEGDNPSVGLIICKSTDKTVVEWSLKDINKPLGVATYKLREVVDRTMAEMKNKQRKSDNSIFLGDEKKFANMENLYSLHAFHRSFFFRNYRLFFSSLRMFGVVHGFA